MTRKDYELIAAAMRAVRVSAANGYPVATNAAERERDGQRAAIHRAACYQLALSLAQDNARFDRDKFIRACGCVE